MVLKELHCSDNNLSALDVSGLTALKTLWCYDNDFTTQVLDALYCTLPQRQSAENAMLCLLENESSPNHPTVQATNGSNATDKNWKILFDENNNSIMTTGTYECFSINMNRWVAFTVKNGVNVHLDLMAAADGTSVRVQSGSIVTDINVDADWMDFHDCLTDGTTLTVYGDITGLDCSENYANLTGMELSPNAILEEVHTY